MTENVKRYDLENYTVGKGVQTARANLGGWTQAQLAIQVGYIKKDVVNMENREHPMILRLLDWCNQLDCDMDFILGFQEQKRKADDDICTSTGLDEDTVQLLKREKSKRASSEVQEGKSGVFSGITTADLFNRLSGHKGKQLKDAMLQYMRETMIMNLHRKKVQNIIDYHNQKKVNKSSFDSVITVMEQTLESVRLSTSLNGLCVAGKEQNKIDDDFTQLCKKLDAEGYSQNEATVMFHYLHSMHRIESLKMKCYNLMINFLEGMSIEGQLKYHSAKFTDKEHEGDFDVTALPLYRITIDEEDRAKDEMLASALKKERARLKTETLETKEAMNRIIETNSMLSAELNDERQKVKKLQEVIDSIPPDKKKLTELNLENTKLKESVSALYEANKGLDEKVRELEKELKKVR